MSKIGEKVSKLQRDNTVTISETCGTAEFTVGIRDERKGELIKVEYKARPVYNLDHFFKARMVDIFEDEIRLNDTILNRVKALILGNMNLNTNIVFAKQSDIARILNVDERQIRYAMQKLKDIDFIRYQKGCRGFFMINPNKICAGREYRERWLRECWDDMENTIKINESMIPKNHRFTLRSNPYLKMLLHDNKQARKE